MKVCVVGFGAAGCIIACSLSKQGYDVTIYERDVNPLELDKQSFKERGYPITIFKAGCEIIHLTNLGKYFQSYKYCQPLEGVIAQGHKNTQGKNIGTMGSRNAIMKSFLEALKEECPSIQIHFKSSVDRINVNKGTVQVNGEEKQCDLIIGADGSGSIIPQQGKTVWLDKNVEPSDLQFLKLYSYLPFFVGAHAPEFQNRAIMSLIYGRNEFNSVEAAKLYLRKVSPWVVEHVTDQELQLFVAKKPANLGRFINANQFYCGNKVAIVGDAIHAFPPSGNGITLAMQGALNLSQKMKLHSDDIPTAFEKYSTSHKRQVDGADIVQTFHMLSYIIFTSYLYALGGVPHLRVRLIVLWEYSFEDIFYFYQASYQYAKTVAKTLILALIFSFITGGWILVLKLVINFCICFLLLNIWTLMTEDLQIYRDERMIIKGVIGALTVLLFILLLIAYFFI